MQNLKSMPKVELHCHLEGSLRPATVLEAHRRRGLNSPTWDLDEFSKLLRADPAGNSLVEFLRPFAIMRQALSTPEAIEQAVYELVEDQAQDNVCYLEIRFSPGYMHRLFNLTYDEIFNAVLAGVDAAVRRFDIVVTLTPGLSRELGPAMGLEVVAASSRFLDRGVTGFDLFGNEADFPPHLFIEVFEQARNYGFAITVHAGEAAGPQSVINALDLLGATRIGHGCRVIENPALVDRLAASDVFLEMCPTSNVQTGAVPSLAKHPLPQLLQRGIVCGVFTDDPTICTTTLTREYEVAVQHLGLSQLDIRNVALSAIDHAFAPDDVRRAVRRRIEAWNSGHDITS